MAIKQRAADKELSESINKNQEPFNYEECRKRLLMLLSAQGDKEADAELTRRHYLATKDEKSKGTVQ